MPVGLALIPFIESSYYPSAVLPCGAVALWQLMSLSGRLFNFYKTWRTQERHDPYGYTKATSCYFKHLYERFDNDIFIALAAYNPDPRPFESQIRKNRRLGLNTHFSALNHAKQFAEFIPKYIAKREFEY